LLQFSSSDANLKGPKEKSAIERATHRPRVQNTVEPISMLLMCWNNRTALYCD